MWNGNKMDSRHPLPAERKLSWQCYIFPWMCSVFTHDWGKELKELSNKVTSSREVLAGTRAQVTPQSSVTAP